MKMAKKLSCIFVLYLLISTIIVACNSEKAVSNNPVSTRIPASSDTPEKIDIPSNTEKDNEPPQEVVPRASPKGRLWHGTAYDTNRERLIIIGGHTSSEGIFKATSFNDVLKEMWSLDIQEQHWHQILDYTNHAIIKNLVADSIRIEFDSIAKTLVVLGISSDESEKIATHIIDPISGNVSTSQAEFAPPARYRPGVVYHSEAKRLVTFGGRYHNNENSGVWTYDVAKDEWEYIRLSLNSAGYPSDRTGFDMTYNSDNNLIYIYGGVNSKSQPTQDFWAFNLDAASWSEIVTEETPKLREMVQGAYDAQSHQYILFGFRSIVGGTPVYETWAFDYEAQLWSNMRPAVSPKLTVPGEAIYSPALDRILFFGGGSVSPRLEVSAETWAYDFEANTWEVIEIR